MTYYRSCKKTFLENLTCMQSYFKIAIKETFDLLLFKYEQKRNHKMYLSSIGCAIFRALVVIYDVVYISLISFGYFKKNSWMINNVHFLFYRNH